jgi:glutamyl-tRNA reductase
MTQNIIPSETTIAMVGLNHRTAPVRLREALAFSDQAAQDALHNFKQRYAGAEAVIISTCNRVELYVVRHTGTPGQPDLEALVEFLALNRGVLAEEASGCIYRMEHRAVVEHLFSVVSSLDSLVLGETQILSQVKRAYQMADSAQTVGPVFHGLFQRSFAAAKDVHDQTGLSDGHVSVASVAVELLRGVFDRFDDKIVLLIGAGKMAALMLRHMVALHPGRMVVTNRTPEKSAEMAGRFKLESADFSRLPELLTAADIVLTSTGAPDPIITAEQIKPLIRARQYRPLVMVDIAVPRDVESGVDKLNNVYLYNIDDLQRVAQNNRLQRGAKVDVSRTIIDRHTSEFMHWFAARNTGPVVKALYQHCRQISDRELDTLLAAEPELTADQREAIRKMAHRLVGKILHVPVTELTTHAAHHRRMHLAGAIQELFHLLPPESPAPGGDATESKK